MAVEVNRTQSIIVVPQNRSPGEKRIEINRRQSAVPRTTTYTMRGMDASIEGRYETWTVSATPDFAGAQYAGSLTTPLRDIVVQSKSST